MYIHLNNLQVSNSVCPDLKRERYTRSVNSSTYVKMIARAAFCLPLFAVVLWVLSGWRLLVPTADIACARNHMYALFAIIMWVWLLYETQHCVGALLSRWRPRRGSLFASCLFFIYFIIDFYYKLYYYTLSLHIAEHNILPLLKLITLTGMEPYLLPNLHL